MSLSPRMANDVAFARSSWIPRVFLAPLPGLLASFTPVVFIYMN
jgi:hypothetical protein